MFKLSRGAEYAIRGLLYLSGQPTGKVSYIEEISNAQQIPRAYLAKIFQTLSKKGFVKSYRGPEGGFALTRDPAELTLLEAVEAMEGPIHLNECLIHSGYCEREDMCPIHDVWNQAHEKLMEVLTGTTFAGLAEAGREKAAKARDKRAAS